MKKQTLLLLTGIYDTLPILRGIWRLIAWNIKWMGIETGVLAMAWTSEESWKDKEKRLLDRIEELGKEGRRVSLLGISAGGTAALIAMNKGRVEGKVITVCSWLRPENMNSPKFRRLAKVSPAFGEAVAELSKVKIEDKKRIMSFKAKRDQVVPEDLQTIEGAKVKKLRSSGHRTAISGVLIWGARDIVSFLRT